MFKQKKKVYFFVFVFLLIILGSFYFRTHLVSFRKSTAALAVEIRGDLKNWVSTLLVHEETREEGGAQPSLLAEPESQKKSVLVFATESFGRFRQRFRSLFDPKEAVARPDEKKPAIVHVSGAVAKFREQLRSLGSAQPSMPPPEESIVSNEPVANIEIVSPDLFVPEEVQPEPIAEMPLAIEEEIPSTIKPAVPKKVTVVPAKQKIVTKVKLLQASEPAEDDVVEVELAELPIPEPPEEVVKAPDPPPAAVPKAAPVAKPSKPGKRVEVVLSESKLAKKKKKVKEEPAPICAPTPVNTRWNPWPLPKLISLRHAEGTNNGVAYATDYSSLAVLSSPDYKPGSFLPMLDLRVHRFDDTAWAANAGLIGRYIPNPSDPAAQARILGLNVYYDWRQANWGYFQELGGGIEVLGRRWDLRANVYFPFGPVKKAKGCEESYTEKHNKRVTYAFNGEVGWLAIDTPQFLLYTAADLYYISKSTTHNSTRGGLFRLRPQYREYVALDLMGSYDPVFKTIWQAEIILYLPLYIIGEPSVRGPYGISNRQVYQPVERSEILPLARYECWESD